MASSSTTPVIDLTAPDSPPRRGEDAPLVASSLTGARAGQEEQQAQPSTSASASTGNATTLPLPPRRSQRIPYPAANAPSTPIDLTDDDIEYLGEQRLHLPDLPHAEGNDARPVQGDNYSLMGGLCSCSLSFSAFPADDHHIQTASETSLG